MTEGLVDRINELARKHKTIGLTAEETAERDMLRKQYLKEFRSDMEKNILDNVYIVDEAGNKTKIEKRNK